MAKKILEVSVILSAADRLSRIVHNSVQKSVKSLDKLQRRTQQLSTSAFSTGRQFGVAGAAMGASLALPIRSAIEFEDKMADARKVIDGLETPEAVREFSAQIMDLSKQVPVAVSGLQDLASAGGRMGIAKDDIIEYARQVSKMAIAFEMEAGIVGEEMGKIASVFAIPINELDKLGDSINFLADNSNAKGPEIIEFLKRTAGNARQLGFIPDQMAALGATMITLGQTAEVAGTAINTSFLRLATAKGGANEVNRALESIGLTAKTVREGMAVSPQNTFLSILEGIKGSSDGLAVAESLFGVMHAGKIAAISENLDLYRGKLALLDEEMKQGSMTREYAIRLETATAKLQLFKNSVRVASVEIGTALLPHFKRLLEMLMPVIERVSSFVRNNKKLVTVIGVVVGALAALSLTISALMFTFGGLVKGYQALIVAKKLWMLHVIGSDRIIRARIALNKIWRASMLSLRTGILASAGAMKILRLALITTGVGAILAGIAIAGVWIYQNWDKVRAVLLKIWDIFLNFTALGRVVKVIIDNWSQITTFFEGLWARVKSFVTHFYDLGSNIVTSIVDGIKSRASALIGTVKDIAGQIRDFFPFSPAKVGPLKDLHKVKIIETIAQNISPIPLTRAMDRAMQPVAAGGGGNTYYNSAQSKSEGSVVINFSPSVNFSGESSPAMAQGDIMSSFKRYEGELIRIIEGAMEKKKRVAF